MRGVEVDSSKYPSAPRREDRARGPAPQTPSSVDPLAPTHTDLTTNNELPSEPRSRTHAVTAEPQLCLSILYHPDPALIGAHARWPWRSSVPWCINRLEPLFTPPDGTAPRPLGISQVSRSSLLLTPQDAGLTLQAEQVRVQFSLGGTPGRGLETVSMQRLEEGIRLELGRHITFLLHLEPDLLVAPTAAPELMGVSRLMRQVRADIQRLASHDLSVLVTGESGVGKELAVQAIHRASQRADKALIALNMAALPASTAAAELFGHAKGAFTGAGEARIGLMRAAHGGTLFLDEVGETPLEVQALLLRALENAEIQPLGQLPQRINVRTIAATDADLAQHAEQGKFKQALRFRLSQTVLHLPPLRARRQDIPLLLVHFLTQALRQEGMEQLLYLRPEGPSWLTRDDVLTLLDYDWPGNVRELRNVAFQMAQEGKSATQARVPEWLQAQLRVPSVRWGFTPSGATPGPGHLREPAAPGLSPQTPLHLPLPPSPDPTPEGKTVPQSDPPSSPRKEPQRLSRLDAHALEEALEMHDWHIGAASQHLGISRRSTYALMAQFGLRAAKSVSGEEILEAATALKSLDVEALAGQLRVSARGLRLRMRALGLIG